MNTTTTPHTMTPAEIKDLHGSDLELVAVTYPTEYGTEGDVWNADLLDASTSTGHDGKCACCGSTRLVYVCTVVHKPTMLAFPMGSTCAHKLNGLQGNLTHRIAAAKEKVRQIKQVATWVAHHPEHADVIAWARSEGAHHIARDMAGKLAKWGSISTKQVDFLYKLQDQAEQQVARKAVQAAELASAPDLEAGRYEISGEVLTTKWQENNFGYGAAATLKMLVKLANGNKVWGTAPGNIADEVDRGSTVSFVASVEVSKDDSHFGFYKRPAKATCVAPAVA
jgi:hypothetical protein